MFKFLANRFSGDKKTERKAPAQGNEIDFNRKGTALEGDLAVVTIENLMQLISHAGLSGELYLVAPENAACFIIDKGTLVFAYLKANSLRIGERLLRKDYITKENLKECLQSYREQNTKPKFGTLLVEKGFLDKDDLEETIKEQVRDIFFESLSWKTGTFSFIPCECALHEEILLDERIDHLIFAGVVQMESEE